MRKFNENREQGAAFEEIFERTAHSLGYWAHKNHLRARRTYNGKLIALGADLDYRLIKRNGKVAYIDCKCFVENFFTYSKIDAEQLLLAQEYEHWKIKSGFVVYFQSINQVVFYKGSVLANLGPRSRVLPEDGIMLGKIERFDLKPIL